MQPFEPITEMPNPPNLKHRFNDDLLISESDQTFAKNKYAEIYHILDHPELRDQFLAYDRLAIGSRLWVQRVGMIAVILSVFALLGSAITPLLRQLPDIPEKLFTILFWAEAGGIIGVVIAAGGLWISRQRKKWLEARMLAEVIRIWHFQSLICRGREIEASWSGDLSQPDAYRKSRKLQFDTFMHEWTGTADSHLTELVENPSSGYQMLHEETSRYSSESPMLEKLFEAYKALRFRHQVNYAVHKLQNHTDKTFNILSWPSAVLQRRIQAFSAFCFLGSLICSLIIVGSHMLHVELFNQSALPVLVIIFLILTVAGRTFQDGLAAPEDLQRYNDYAGKMRYLLGRFEVSNSVSERLDLMEEAERAALEELKGFLRSHSEARFVI